MAYPVDSLRLEHSPVAPTRSVPVSASLTFRWLYRILLVSTARSSWTRTPSRLRTRN
jgi:hypothetical protein